MGAAKRLTAAQQTELDALVRAQQREMEAESGRRRYPAAPFARGVVRECDLCPDTELAGLDAMADARQREPLDLVVQREAEERAYQAASPTARTAFERRRLHLLGFDSTWNAAIVGYDPKQGACPCCHDTYPAHNEVCLCCHSGGQDHRQHPMQAPTVGLHWDGSPFNRLAGGLGKLSPAAAKFRSELAARAKAARAARKAMGGVA